MKSDAEEYSVLLMLDLTSVFDAVAQHIMLDRLSYWLGISGFALEWFASYCSE